MTTRKKYSKEFKLDAVSLVTDEATAGSRRHEAWVSMPICCAAGCKRNKLKMARPSGEMAN
jgi:hypothetical protein